MSRRGGWRRVGSRRSFRYVDAHGDLVTAAAQLERIERLRIPPAWRDVWISPNPRARLQAVGLDAAGRKQYLYHPDFRAAQEQAKYDRLVRFGERLPELRSAAADDIELGDAALDRVRAAAVTLVNSTWFRVGSERYARTSRTYGVTTLTKRHVSVNGVEMRFAFRSKSGTLVRRTLVDDMLADTIRDLLDLPGGGRVFRWRRSDGTLVALTPPLLNGYIREHMGDGFSAKDFRTWGGTLTAAVALAEHGVEQSEAKAKRAIVGAMRRVGEQLANTPAVARTSYVSPAVVEQYLDGCTLEDFRPSRLRIVSAGQRGLEPEEQALLSLLRSWRIKRALQAA